MADRAGIVSENRTDSENRNLSQENSDTQPTERPFADTVIVSAFGRGDWLAAELSGRGFRVTLVDVTETLGAVQPEDAEGPFGFLEATDLLPTQKTRLTEEGEMVTVEEGFTIWTKGGPLECRSELTSFQLEARLIPKNVENYLRHPGLPDRESERARHALLKMPFRETWLAHLAHQMTSTAIEENHRGLDWGAAAPIFAPYSIRQVTAQALGRGLKKCQSSGVKIRQKAEVRDLRMENRSVDAIEIHDDQSGIERGKSFVWMLSSSETEQSAKTLFATLFPGGVLKAEWFWTRYRINLDLNRNSVDATFDDQIPAHVVVIEDLFLPWTHENMIVFRKRAIPGQYDAWIRVPGRLSDDQATLGEYGLKIEKILRERMPSLRPSLVNESQRELTLTQALAPVFGTDQLEDLEQLRAPNLFYCGPEQWETLDWTGRYRAQNQILAKLEKLRAQWLAAEAKASARAAKARDKARTSNP